MTTDDRPGGRPPRENSGAPRRGLGPAFGVLWTANLMTGAAGWCLGLVAPVHVYSRTGSATAATCLFLATAAPAAVLGTLTGRLADRLDRRWTLAVACLVRVPVLAALAIAGGTSRDDALPVVLLLVLLDAVARQVGVPAEQGLVADIAGHALPAATSANSVSTNLARLAAPAAGGALYAVVGFPGTVWVLATLQALAALLLLGLACHGRRPGPVHPPRGKHQGRSGFRVLGEGRHLRSITVLYAVDGVKEGALGSLFAAFMLSVAHAGPPLIGLAHGVFAVGALCAAPAVPVVVRRWGYRWPVALGASVSALALLPALVWPGGTSAVVAFAVAGVPFTISWVAAGTMLLLHAPAGRRSTAVGAAGAVWATAMLTGAAVAGPLADRIGLVPVLLAACLLHAAAGPVVLVLSRDRPVSTGQVGP